jgi:hypothetical protein
VLGILQRPPPLPDAGARQHGRELVNLALSQGPQRNASSTQDRRHHASVPFAGVVLPRYSPAGGSSIRMSGGCSPSW